MSELNSKIRKITSIPLSIAFKKVIYSPFKKIISYRKFIKLNSYLSGHKKHFFSAIEISEINFSNFLIINEFEKLTINFQYISDILNHKISIFNSEPFNINLNNVDIELGAYKRFDWTKDFFSGFRWTNEKDFNQIKIGLNQGEEIKVPWELARLHQLVALSFAYSRNDIFLDEKIIYEYENQIVDFIQSNPPYKGIHWIVPMEVAIRSINILFSLSILTSKGYKLPEFIANQISKYLYISCIFIFLNKEWSSGLRNNHYLADLVGLLFISKCYPKSKEMEKINKFAVSEFIKEIKYQFNNDGSNFEGSLPYHFFSTEMVYFGLEYLRINNHNFLKDIRSKVETIINFNKTVVSSDGYYPQIGDNDSGKIIDIIKLYSLHDNYVYHKMINDVLNSIYNIKYGEYLINVSSDKPYNHCVFNNIGIFTYKNDDFQLWISFGRKAQSGKGGHNHSDAFSFILRYKEKEIFSDPGTYVYTSSPELRNTYRSSKSHNCFYKPDFDNFDFKSIEDLFWLKEDTCNFEIKEKNEFIDFKILKTYNGKKIVRNFNISETEIVITDTIHSDFNDGIISFHLHPHIKDLEILDNYTLKLNRLIRLESNVKFKIHEYNYSKGYKQIEQAHKILFENLNSICEFKIKMI